MEKEEQQLTVPILLAQEVASLRLQLAEYQVAYQQLFIEKQELEKRLKDERGNTNAIEDVRND